LPKQQDVERLVTDVAGPQNNDASRANGAEIVSSPDGPGIPTFGAGIEDGRPTERANEHVAIDPGQCRPGLAIVQRNVREREPLVAPGVIGTGLVVVVKREEVPVGPHGERSVRVEIDRWELPPRVVGSYAMPTALSLSGLLNSRTDAPNTIISRPVQTTDPQLMGCGASGSTLHVSEPGS
jgi:hypothetical protein